MRRSDKVSYWEQVMAECAQSGMSKQDFCASRGIQVGTFYYWQRRLREQPQAAERTGFRQLQPDQHYAVEVQLPDGRWQALRCDDVDDLAAIVERIGRADA